jgi:hypothetical protein
LPKKIEFDLLLADLALQFGDASAGEIKLVGWHLYRPARSRGGRRPHVALARPPQWTQGRRTAGAKLIAPSVYILPQNLELSRHQPYRLARQNTSDGRKLELSTEDTGWLLGHVFSYGELSLISSASLLGCTP